MSQYKIVSRYRFFFCGAALPTSGLDDARTREVLPSLVSPFAGVSAICVSLLLLILSFDFCLSFISSCRSSFCSSYRTSCCSMRLTSSIAEVVCARTFVSRALALYRSGHDVDHACAPFASSTLQGRLVSPSGRPNMLLL